MTASKSNVASTASCRINNLCERAGQTGTLDSGVTSVGVSQTIAVSIGGSEKSSVVRSNGVLHLVVQSNLCSEDSYLLVLGNECAILNVTDSLDLSGINDIEVQQEVAVLNVLSSIEACNCDVAVLLILSSSAGAIFAVAREDCKVLDSQLAEISAGGIEVVASNEVLNEEVFLLLAESGILEALELTAVEQVPGGIVIVSVNLGHIGDKPVLVVNARELSSLNTEVVEVGDEDEAAERTEDKNVQLVELVVDLVEFFVNLTDIFLKSLDVILVGLNALVKSVDLAFDLLYLCLIFGTQVGDELAEFGNNLLLELLQASLVVGDDLLLLFEVLSKSLASLNLIFETLLESFDTLQSLAKIGLDSFHLSPDLSGLFLEGLLVELIFLQVANQLLEFGDYLFLKFLDTHLKSSLGSGSTDDLVGDSLLVLLREFVGTVSDFKSLVGCALSSCYKTVKTCNLISQLLLKVGQFGICSIKSIMQSFVVCIIGV